MIKLLVVVPFYKPAYVYGGPVRSVSALCEGLSKIGNEITVFTTKANGSRNLDVPECTPVCIDGVNTVYFPWRSFPLLFHSLALGRACAREMGNFDLAYVVSCWGYPFIPACRAARVSHVPYVVSPRNAFDRRTWKGKYLKKSMYHLLFERAHLQKATAIHYTTQQEALASRWLRLDSNAIIVPNPVDLSEFESLPERGAFRQRWGIGENVRIALYMGRVEPDKGLDIAVRSVALAQSCRRSVVFIIAGPEEDGHDSLLRALASDLGIKDRVLFTGMLSKEDRLSAFRDADAFVPTSSAENFSMATVEAMAAGIPVVITNTIGIAPDVLKSGAGLVCPPDPRAIGDALVHILKSQELGCRMGSAGRGLSRQAYAPDVVARQWLKKFGPLGRNAVGHSRFGRQEGTDIKS